MESREELTKKYNAMHGRKAGQKRPLNDMDKMRLRVMTEADAAKKNTKKELENLSEGMQSDNPKALARFFGIFADRKKKE
jgi:hypothetical protein